MPKNFLEKLFKYDFILTSFRLNNILTGGVYPLQNTKIIVRKLPYDLNESVYITANWMYQNKLIKHNPKKYDKT